MPRERGQMPYFKDVATPADVADGGGVRGYAATGSSPRAGSSDCPRLLGGGEIILIDWHGAEHIV